MTHELRTKIYIFYCRLKFSVDLIYGFKKVLTKIEIAIRLQVVLISLALVSTDTSCIFHH